MAIEIGYCPVCTQKMLLGASGHLPPHSVTSSTTGAKKCPGSGAVPIANPRPPRPKSTAGPNRSKKKPQQEPQ